MDILLDVSNLNCPRNAGVLDWTVCSRNTKQLTGLSFTRFDTVTGTKPHVFCALERSVTSAHMAVTHTFTVGRDQCFQQIEKLTKSHSLHSSESLCKLLRTWPNTRSITPASR